MRAGCRNSSHAAARRKWRAHQKTKPNKAELREGPSSGIYFEGLHHRLQSERRVFYRSPASLAFTNAAPRWATTLATAPMMMRVAGAKNPKNLASGAWSAGEVRDAVVRAAVNETEIYLGAEGELV